MNHSLWALMAFLLMFVGLWSTEHNNRIDFVAQRKTFRSRVAEGRSLSLLQRPAYAVRMLPLPDDIPAGWYCVSDSCGRRLLIELSAAQIGPAIPQPTRPPRDFYVQVLDGQHWIYETIREPASLELQDAMARITFMDFPHIANMSQAKVGHPTDECLETECPLESLSQSPASVTEISRFVSVLNSYFQQRFDRMGGELLDRIGELGGFAGGMTRSLFSFWVTKQWSISDWLNSFPDYEHIAAPQPADRAL